MTYDDQTVEALSQARQLVRRMGFQSIDASMISSLRQAFNQLDNAGVFAEIDEWDHEKEVAAQFAAGAIDPAEWGDDTRADDTPFARSGERDYDTTRSDMTRYQRSISDIKPLEY